MHNFGSFGSRHGDFQGSRELLECFWMISSRDIQLFFMKKVAGDGWDVSRGSAAPHSQAPLFIRELFSKGRTFAEFEHSILWNRLEARERSA